MLSHGWKKRKCSPWSIGKTGNTQTGKWMFSVFPQHLHCLHQGFLNYSSSNILGVYDTCRLSNPTEDLGKAIPRRDPEVHILMSPLGHPNAHSFENSSSINLVFKYRISEKSFKIWSKVLCLSIKKIVLKKKRKL